jgi:hypothetical protein
MKALLSVLAVLSLCAVACNSDDDDGANHQATAGAGGGSTSSDKEGLRMCCELGAICHDAPNPSDVTRDCHDIGHLSEPAQCRQNYERCLTACRAAGAGGGSEHACVD